MAAPTRTVDEPEVLHATASVADAGTSTAPPASAGSSAPPAVGTRYVLGEEIARGGMGEVYRATDTVMGREVAVKVLQAKYGPESGSARRFADEARISGQLQHPNIPAVHDLGTLPDGRPFLAMKLIKGETLDQQLKARPDPAADRGKFVAVFEAICQAVAYAHAHGVLHRDLKPANVMVGGFGEVQVMDWGLAKVLGDRGGVDGDPESTSAETEIKSLRDSADLLTQTGSVLGTPAYMPPEQAIGAIDQIDRRSDVFGLGGILAAILTGRPPFQGETAESTRQMAAKGKVAGCFARLDASGADPELVALCKRCLAPEKDDRPTDAGAVAAAVHDLRAAADERARQAELDRVRAEAEAREQRKRRRVLLVAGGSVAAVLVAGMGLSLWQMNRAVSAEALAKENETAANTERDAKGRALEAETAARSRAFAALRSMTEEVVERKFAQGVSLTADDKAFLRSVIAQFDAFAAVAGDDADSRAIRAEGRYRVGLMLFRLGDLKPAEVDLDTAVALLEPLAAEFPARPEFRRDLAFALNVRGRLMRATGRLKETERDFEAALAHRLKLSADFPDRPEFRQAMASSLNNRGVVRGQLGRLKESEADYAAAIVLQTRLVADFPDNPEYRASLARSHKNRGGQVWNAGRLKEAEEEYTTAVTHFGRLVTDHPANPEYRQELAISHDQRARLRRGDNGRSKEAEADFEAALVLRRQLAADFPTVPDFRNDLAGSHAGRGHLLMNRQRFDEALRDFDAALALHRQLAADFPALPGFRSNLAGSHNDRCNLFRNSRRLKEALPDHDAAIAIQAKLAADFPATPEYRDDLARSYNNRGFIHKKLGRLGDAERDYAAALELSKKLAADSPARPGYHRDLARTHINLGNLFLEAGRTEDAARHYAPALDLRRQLAADAPGDVAAQCGWATGIVRMAGLRLRTDGPDAAGRLLDEAATILDPVRKAHPDNEEIRQPYRDFLGMRIGVHAAKLERDDALRTTATLRDLGWDPLLDTYDAGCALSLCVSLVTAHAKLNDGQRKEAARLYADEAMKLLRLAVDKGWKDPDQMKNDADLAPLSAREDFVKLVAELEAKAPTPPEIAPLPREKK